MSKKGKRTVSKGKDYYAYLRSAAWAAKKEEFRQNAMLAKTTCYICDKPWDNSFNIHHKTYKNLGCEDLRDLVSVCRECHVLIHNVHKEKTARNRSRYINLWNITDHLRKKRQASRIAYATDSIDKGSASILYFYGGCIRSNVGIMHVGVVLDGESLYTRLDQGTQGVADWLALLWGLQIAHSRGIKNIKVFGSNETTIKQANGLYKIKDAKLIEFRKECQALSDVFEWVSASWLKGATNLARALCKENAKS
jgi:ribonuclease HI